MHTVNHQSTEMERVETSDAPGAIGAYSQGTTFGDMIFISGQLGMDPKTKELPEDVEKQAERSLSNLKAIVEAAGGSLHTVMKTTVLLANIEDFEKVNTIYAKYFDGPIAPARACFAVKTLPRYALVEIEAVAFKKK